MKAPRVFEAARRGHGEEGAALIIALIFLVAGTLTVLALTNLTSVNLTSTFSLQGERAVEYAADGGTAGAVHAFRYAQSASSCPSTNAVFYHPSTSFTEDSVGYFSGVSCSFLTPATGSSSGTNHIAPAAGTPGCLPQEIGQQVFDPSKQGNIPPGTVVTGCSGTSWTISLSATGTSSTVKIGTPGENLVTFYGCSEESAFTSSSLCTPSEAFVTAIVIFYNTDATGAPKAGYGATVLSWIVSRANG